MVDDLIADIEPESNQESSIHSSILSTWLVAFLLYMQAAFRLTDRAVSAILAFLKVFLKVLGRISGNSLILTLSEAFPTSLYVARKCIGSTSGIVQFTRYVVCSLCHSLYCLDSCIEGSGRFQKGKLCSFIQFPNHSQRRMRQPCHAIISL